MLSLPAGPGPFPAVVFADGSRPRVAEPEIPGDPDASSWYWAIADELNRGGVAALLLDSRGFGRSGGRFDDASLADSAADVAAAISELRRRDDIAPTRIGILGQSMGTAVAQLAATRSRGASFAVLLAAIGRPGDDLMMEQTERAWGRLAEKYPEARLKVKMTARLYALCKTDATADAIARTLTREFGGLPEMKLVANEDDVRSLSARFSTPRYRSFLRYDPGDVLKDCHVPVLGVWGTSDVIVDAERNATGLRDAFAPADRDLLTTLKIAGLDHGLRSADAGKSGEVIETRTLKRIVKWVIDQERGGGSPAEPRPAPVRPERGEGGREKDS
jgi:uncharacterized protein